MPAAFRSSCGALLRAGPPRSCRLLAVAAAQRGKKKGVEPEVTEAIRRRLQRRPLVLSTHAAERMTSRGVAQEEVELLLACGAINRANSRFGGKPSPMYALEGCCGERRLCAVFAANETATVLLTVLDLGSSSK